MGGSLLSPRLDDRVVKLAEPIVAQWGLELVDIQYRKEGPHWYLRVFIDKEGGVGLEDCQRVSEGLGGILDRSDPIPHNYILEVSSPGLERPLKKKKDFIRFQGHEIKVRTYAPIDGRRNFRGQLQGVMDEFVVMEVDKKSYSIPMEKIAKAQLVVEF
ncbi:MAG: ribosome maturation factor RimP [Firmicutes bacterium]|nr:ribosome maturation factor RimP [Bacillota bacterium]